MKFYLRQFVIYTNQCVLYGSLAVDSKWWLQLINLESDSITLVGEFCNVASMAMIYSSFSLVTLLFYRFFCENQRNVHPRKFKFWSYELLGWMTFSWEKSISCNLLRKLRRITEWSFHDFLVVSEERRAHSLSRFDEDCRLWHALSFSELDHQTRVQGGKSEQENGEDQERWRKVAEYTQRRRTVKWMMKHTASLTHGHRLYVISRLWEWIK